MQLLPAPFAAAAVFGGGPFALAEDRQAGAVYDEIKRSRRRPAIKGDVQWLAPPGQRRVVRRVESGGHQCQDRPQEALRLAQRQAEDEPQGQNAVSIARFENFRAPPGRPDGAGLQACIASAESQRVTSPRPTRARSYSGQLLTGHLVLYLGCTLEFTAELCDTRRRKGQRCRDRHSGSGGNDLHQRLTDRWLLTYNQERPHDSLGRVPPLTFLPRVNMPAQSPLALSA